MALAYLMVESSSSGHRFPKGHLSAQVVGNTLQHVFMVMEYIEHELKLLVAQLAFGVADVKCLLRQLLTGLQRRGTDQKGPNGCRGTLMAYMALCGLNGLFSWVCSFASLASGWGLAWGFQGAKPSFALFWFSA